MECEKNGLDGMGCNGMECNGWDGRTIDVSLYIINLNMLTVSLSIGGGVTSFVLFCRCSGKVLEVENVVSEP